MGEEAYRRAVEEVVGELGVDPARGLSADEARTRLETHGRNELPAEPPTPAWRRFLGQFKDPLTILLLVATVVSFVAWLFERETPIPYEAIVILAIVVLNGVLGFVQENRAEQAVAALRAMAAPTARVLRLSGHRTCRPARSCRATCCCWRRATPSRPTPGCWSRSCCGRPRRR